MTKAHKMTWMTFSLPSWAFFPPTELIAMHFGIGKSVKETCNAALDCGQN